VKNEEKNPSRKLNFKIEIGGGIVEVSDIYIKHKFEVMWCFYVGNNRFGNSS
jgi:hypothetical protein